MVSRTDTLSHREGPVSCGNRPVQEVRFLGRELRWRTMRTHEVIEGHGLWEAGGYRQE